MMVQGWASPSRAPSTSMARCILGHPAAWASTAVPPTFGLFQIVAFALRRDRRHARGQYTGRRASGGYDGRRHHPGGYPFTTQSGRHGARRALTCELQGARPATFGAMALVASTRATTTSYPIHAYARARWHHGLSSVSTGFADAHPRVGARKQPSVELSGRACGTAPPRRRRDRSLALRLLGGVEETVHNACAWTRHLGRCRGRRRRRGEQPPPPPNRLEIKFN